MTRRLWHSITRNPDGSELFGCWLAGPVMIALVVYVWVRALFG